MPRWTGGAWRWATRVAIALTRPRRPGPTDPLSVESIPPGDPEGGYRYFAELPRGWTRARPAGVVRRSRSGDRLDQAFTRNLRWEPTTALRDHESGFHDDLSEYVEITRAEADEFVRDVTTRLGRS